MTEKELTEEQRAKLAALLAELASYRGRHTELISVYIAAGSSLPLAVSQLEAERATAQNIKSKTTRKNVIDALEKLIRQLKLYKKLPENGLALFCGNISKIEGRPDIRLWVIEPPLPLKLKLYRCDQEFLLEPLREMLEERVRYGLIVIDRKEATLGLLEGKAIKMLKHLTSGVPGKIRAGGQCLHPSTLILANSSKRLKEVKAGEEIKCYDFKRGLSKTTVLKVWKTKKEAITIETEKGKIVASRDHLFFVFRNGIVEVPAEQLALGDALLFLNGAKIEAAPIKALKKMVGSFELIDLSTKAGNFIANGFIVHNSALRFERLREEAKKEFFRRVASYAKELFYGMPKLEGLLVGGPGPTKEEWLKESQLITALQEKIRAVRDIGYADEHGLHLLVEACEDVLAEQAIMKEKRLLERFFTCLAKEPEKTVYGKEAVERALDAGAVEQLLISVELEKESALRFEAKAKALGAEVHYISTETAEGRQFKNFLVAALLRFALK